MTFPEMNLNSYGLKEVFACNSCTFKTMDISERSEREVKKHVNVAHMGRYAMYQRKAVPK